MKLLSPQEVATETGLPYAKALAQERLGHADISTTVNIKNPYEQRKESK